MTDHENKGVKSLNYSVISHHDLLTASQAL